MLQLLEFPAISGKRWQWHLVLFKEWLRTVEAGISDRKYTKWLRARKVFDRKFMQFVETFLGIEHPAGKAPTLSDVAIELLEELGKSEKRAQQEQAQLLDAGPGRDAPRSRGRSLPPAPGSKQAQSVEARPQEDTFKPPSAESDAFLRALLERFNELNSYLSMFVYKEIKDDFLAPNELFRRIGTNDYLGRRQSMPQFQAWIVWVEWLGGLKKVGFRHKFTQAGKDVGAYLVEMPVDELLGPEPEDAAEAPAEEAKGETPPEPKDASEEQPGLGGGDFDDDDEFEEEGLDLPPSADVEDAIPYWKKDDAAQPPPALAPDEPKADEPKADEPKADEGTDIIALPAVDDDEAADETDDGEQVTQSWEDAETRTRADSRTRADTSEPITKAYPTPLELPPVPKTGSGSRRIEEGSSRVTWVLPESAEVSNGDRREALRQATRWWLDRPHRDKPLSESGVSVRPHASGKPVALFKLLALATLLEGEGPPGPARELFEALNARGVLEALLVDGAPLERALEVAWRIKAPAYLEQRLVHLVRYRRGLGKLQSDSLWTGSAHDAARILQEIVTGDTLGPGLIFVLRELSAGGAGPTRGLEGISWLPSLLED